MNNLFNEKAKNWDMNAVRVETSKKIGEQIKKQAALHSQMRALEFGAGTGLLGMELIDSVGHLTFLDTSEEMLEQVKIKLNERGDSKGDILHRDLTLENLDEKYDFIFSQMTLHHVKDYQGVLTKLISSLNPGGFLSICDLCEEDGSFHESDEPVPHYGFNPVSLGTFFESLGLENVQHSTPFVRKRVRGGQEREYPLFLITASKPL